MKTLIVVCGLIVSLGVDAVIGQPKSSTPIDWSSWAETEISPTTAAKGREASSRRKSKSG